MKKLFPTIQKATKKCTSTVKSEWNTFLNQVHLSSLFVVIGLFSIAFWTTDSTDDFGLNAFTELLGVALTIFIVNRVFENRQKREELPARILVYKEITAMTNRIILFWSRIEMATSVERSNNVDELLNQENIARLAQKLDLLGDPPPNTAKNWLEFFEQEITLVQNYHTKLLSNYVNHLTPDQVSLIHGIAEESIFSLSGFHGMVNSYNENVKKYSSNMSIFPSYLSAILPAPNYSYSNIIELHHICLEENIFLEEQGISWLEPPTKVTGTGGGTASSLLTPERKRTQAKVPELIPWWKDVYGWQSTHPGNWWLRENPEFNDPVIVRA